MRNRLDDLEYSLHSFYLAISHPDLYCCAPNCPDSNWGGHDRVHKRQPKCPPTPTDEMRRLLALVEGLIDEEETSVDT